jgi:hypothetical protein
MFQLFQYYLLQAKKLVVPIKNLSAIDTFPFDTYSFPSGLYHIDHIKFYCYIV